MKDILKMLAVFIFLLIFIIMSHFLFFLPKTKVDFNIDDLKADTTLINPIFFVDDEFGRYISLRAKGQADDSTEIYIKSTKNSDKLLIMQLPRGKFDIIKKAEFYEKRADIVFLHKKSKKGNITLQFRFLKPSLDTLEQ